MSSDDPYCYPGSPVLKNRFGFTDAAALDRMERGLVAQRAMEGAPKGDFDLTHLCAIHRHLFQDIYEWAGEIRTLEISKDGSQFIFRQYIETGMRDIHKRLVRTGFLHNLSAGAFVEAVGAIIGDVNYIHPFREGNGRTQMEYLEQLADRAGHPLDLLRIDPPAWIDASRAAHQGDYGPMCAEIARCLLACS